MHLATTIAVTLLTAHAATYVHTLIHSYAHSKKPAREYYVPHSRPVQVEQQTADAASPGKKVKLSLTAIAWMRDVCVRVWMQHQIKDSV